MGEKKCCNRSIYKAMSIVENIIMKQMVKVLKKNIFFLFFNNKNENNQIQELKKPNYC